MKDAKGISKARIDGKTAIVTGSNTGIGKYTVRELYLRGGRVIMACRNVEKANEAAQEIKESCTDYQDVGEIAVTELDLASLDSVRKCARRLLDTERRIDLLINNAGVMMCPESKTADGFEMQFGTNHLGHFLFTLLLLPKICQSTPARILTLSSGLHRGHIDFDDVNYEKRKYGPINAYIQSKLANVLFTRELSRKLKEYNVEGVNAYCVNPGAIKTDLQRHTDTLSWGTRMFFNAAIPFLSPTEEGVKTTIYCAIDEKCANETGLYYTNAAPQQPCGEARNDQVAKKLWDFSLELVGLEKSYNPFKV